MSRLKKRHPLRRSRLKVMRHLMSAHSAAAGAAAIAEDVVAGEAVEIHNLAMKMHLHPTTQRRLGRC